MVKPIEDTVEIERALDHLEGKIPFWSEVRKRIPLVRQLAVVQQYIEHLNDLLQGTYTMDPASPICRPVVFEDFLVVIQRELVRVDPAAEPIVAEIIRKKKDEQPLQTVFADGFKVPRIEDAPRISVPSHETSLMRFSKFLVRPTFPRLVSSCLVLSRESQS